MTNPQESFHAIIMDAIERARKVPCGVPEFIDGLQAMIDELDIELDAAEESDTRE